MSDPVLMDNGMYKIDFSMGEGELLYQDALYIPQKSYDVMAPADIEALKQQRYDNWLAIVTPIITQSTAPDVSGGIANEGIISGQ